MSQRIELLEARLTRLEIIVKCQNKTIEDLQDCCDDTPVCAAPIISSISGDASLIEGEELSLTVVAAGTTPLTYQWYFNDVLIDGATSSTYVIDEVTTENEGTFKVVVTNSCGDENSETGVTVTPLPAPITVYWRWDTVDPYDQINILDDLTYQGSLDITHNQDIPADFRPGSSGGNRYFTMKEPDTEIEKTAWFNTQFNYGVFPDQAWLAPFVVEGWRYYTSRTDIGLDPTQLTVFSS